MTKVLKREVQRAHDAWANAATRWGDDNLETVRCLIRYRALRETWEAQTGRPFIRPRS